MDPLSDIIALLRPNTVVSKPITGRGRWGVRYAAYLKPGFTIVLAGACWIRLEEQQPMRLERGDFVLLPAAPAFALYSDPDVACVPTEPSWTPVRHGDPEGEPDFVSLGGAFEIDAVNAPLLLALLPDMIHVRASDAGAERLRMIIDLIAEECAADRPGQDTILRRLLEVMLVEALRWRGVRDETGLLGGLGDPALGKALRAMHGDVRANWTVSELAGIAGMSRSAFAARFSKVLDCGPLEYLLRWRMALAQDALIRGGTSLDRIAEEIGYESASAFSTAFRKRMGSAPGQFAKAHRADLIS